MPKVSARREEHPESILRRFKRACEKAGLLTELKRKQQRLNATSKNCKKKCLLHLEGAEAGKIEEKLTAENNVRGSDV